MNTLILSCVSAAALLIATHTAAQAPHGSSERAAVVYVGDLDLGTRYDAQTLYERIDYAAQALCAAQRRGARRRCIERAVASAVERVGAPLLTAIHLQQSEQVARL